MLREAPARFALSEFFCLATISVAAYANVGVIYNQSNVLFASALEEPVDQDGGGVLKSKGAVAYIESIYEVTYDETTDKHTYTKVTSGEFRAFLLDENAQYVVRTTAYMNETFDENIASLVKNQCKS